MMGPAFYVMAILGCGEADAACEPVGVTEQMYESIEACTEATPDAVNHHSDLAYPVVVAQCQPGDQAVSYKILPQEVDLPEPQREPDFRRATLRKGPVQI
ncbi:hypothetical protein DF286_06430 [Sphingosinicella humi]|uniref:Uncharacterized protein n=2 Tax=Allosphingosinicella humi TaxID=2068657 RepID=A0A2U2J2M3_9SPHN|nr:hypothetical protein DF286_06430 [Sphingosinicella humi]